MSMFNVQLKNGVLKTIDADSCDTTEQDYYFFYQNTKGVETKEVERIEKDIVEHITIMDDKSVFD